MTRVPYRSQQADVRVMAEPEHPKPTAPEEAKIEISLNRLPQLFNSLDPSPFHERDLDQDAEDYIISSAEEIGLQRPIALVIHLPADQLPSPARHRPCRPPSVAQPSAASGAG